MGFRGGNPEPSPGEYDWTSLDWRVEMMRRTGARIVITLCCAPDWMKGGEPGETNWDNIAVSTEEETRGRWPYRRACDCGRSLSGKF